MIISGDIIVAVGLFIAVGLVFGIATTTDDLFITKRKKHEPEPQAKPPAPYTKYDYKKHTK